MSPFYSNMCEGDSCIHLSKHDEGCHIAAEAELNIPTSNILQITIHCDSYHGAKTCGEMNRKKKTTTKNSTLIF